jgi:hypothetical protein
MRELVLDSGSGSERVGFASLRLAVNVVEGLPVEAWRIIGGWMVRAWTETAGAGGKARPTVDVDLGILPQRAAGLSGLIPLRLSAAGLKPAGEHLPRDQRGSSGFGCTLIQPVLSQPVWGSRLFSSRLARFAFELPPSRSG